MKKIIIICLSLFLARAAIFSQKKDSLYQEPVNRATLFGIGNAFLTDTYLSPIKYNGLTMSLLHERLRASHIFGRKVSLQQQFHLQIATTQNPTHTASAYYGNVNYMIADFFPVIKNSSFRWIAGPGWDFSLGDRKSVCRERV